MRTIYTQYVRALESREVSLEEFESLWEQLRRDAVLELRRRGLWTVPPVYLGYPEATWTADALEELLQDCYLFIFGERLNALKGHACVSPDISGLVVRNVRNYLTERQRKADPIGYRVYDTTLNVVKQAVQAGDLHVLAGGLASKISNETVLGFSPRLPQELCTDLERWVTVWSRELLPDLITARGMAVPRVVDRLRRMILDLEDHRVRAFCFKDLLNPLRQEVRRYWTGIWAKDDEAVVVSSHAFEDQESFEKLVSDVRASISELAVKESMKGRLHRLWEFLASQARDQESADSQLSYRKLSEEIAVPRGSLPESFSILRKLVSSRLVVDGESRSHADAPESRHRQAA